MLLTLLVCCICISMGQVNPVKQQDVSSCDEGGSCGSAAPILGKVPQRIVVPNSSDVYISVKTAGLYHEPRLSLLLLTWMQTVNHKQVHIVTDFESDDEWIGIAKNAGFTVIKADCPTGHVRKALCCKSGVEYEEYYMARDSGEKYEWYCHFDDDIYVNIPALVASLGQFNPTEEKLYVGKWPWSGTNKERIEIPQLRLEAFPEHKHSSFYYATGAAYCVSSTLMAELEPYLRGSIFELTGEKLRLPDDMLVGAVVESILGYDMTEVSSMNSHLFPLRKVRPETLKDQVTISYGVFTSVNAPPVQNIVNIPDGVFSVDEDPTRFLSYHCLLYPQTLWCSHWSEKDL